MPLSSCCTVCTEAEWFCFAGQVEPFTSVLPEGLFNMSRFLLHCMEEGTPRGVSKVYPSLLLFGVRHIIHYVSCCSHLPVHSIHPDTLSVIMLVAVPIYLSVNPSRHIICNYVSCCSHLPVCQSIQTHYPLVSCCSHLPVNPPRHIIHMLVAVPIYLSINPFISVLVGLFQPLCSAGTGCPHCCCACFQ